MKTVLVGVNSRNNQHRIWFEGKDLKTMGLNPGQRFDLTIKGGKVVGKFLDQGKRKVSKKTVAGELVPVLDLDNREIHKYVKAHGIEAVTITIGGMGFTISPTEAAKNKKARVERSDHIDNSGVTLGSLFSGGGIFDHAAHAGMTESGHRVESAFAVEINQYYASVAATNNPLINTCNTPLQHIVHTLPQCDVLLAGIPCNGASFAGMSKNALKRPEQHPQVGDMAYFVLRAIEQTQPITVLIENVPNYENTASADIIKSVLIMLGYSISTRVVTGAEVGALENRKRWFLLATNNGASLDSVVFQRPAGAPRTVGDILEKVDPAKYQTTQPFSKKKALDTANGNGFSECNEPVVASDTSVKTIGAGYIRRRPSEPYLKDSHGFRWFTPNEHAKLKGVPTELVRGVAATLAHEILGQSGCYQIIKQILAQIVQKPRQSQLCV